MADRPAEQETAGRDARRWSNSDPPPLILQYDEPLTVRSEDGEMEVDAGLGSEPARLRDAGSRLECEGANIKAPPKGPKAGLSKRLGGSIGRKLPGGRWRPRPWVQPLQRQPDKLMGFGRRSMIGADQPDTGGPAIPRDASLQLSKTHDASPILLSSTFTPVETPARSPINSNFVLPTAQSSLDPSLSLRPSLSSCCPPQHLTSSASSASTQANARPPLPRLLDSYRGPEPSREVEDLSANLQSFQIMEDPTPERRHPPPHHSRKRRHRGDDDRDERPARRNRYEEPIASKLRREVLAIAEAPRKTAKDEAAYLGRQIASNFDDDQVRGPFLDTMLQIVIEQPFKVPHIAAVVQYANDINSETGKEVLRRAIAQAQQLLEEGTWREFKLLIRFFACMQGMYEDDGVFTVLEDLFNCAVDLQTASQEDAVGLELVKIILLTIPYIFMSTAVGIEQKVLDLLEKTDIVASSQHPLEFLVNPYPSDSEDKPFGYQSSLLLLQKQLQEEASQGWKFACLPRLYVPRVKKEPNGDEAMVDSNESEEKGDVGGAKHAFPAITMPSPIHPGPTTLFPEAYFSLYADQELESVPRTNNSASSLIRDAITDTINMLDYNRNAVAKFLIDLDCFYAPGTFAKRAIPFDRLKEVSDGSSTWKPEDLIVDAIFSQQLKLPAAEHKLVYYHSVITEACKLAPAAIAPTLGRGIRFLYRNIDHMDMELAYRFLDWFAHHLSNFDFRWKWTEWVEDVQRSAIDPKKAFIISALDKEIRLSFAKRIRETLPVVYHSLIPEGKDNDTPEFKYIKEENPYSHQGRQILGLLRKKVPEAEIQEVIDSIHTQAIEAGVSDPLIPSTDAYMTAVCFIGSKSLSHVLSCIERCKERLLAIGSNSEAARRQIIASVVDYWRDQPGTAVNIVDKLLNYTIVTPESVALWALNPSAVVDDVTLLVGPELAQGWRYEMVASMVGKVTNRVRQIVSAATRAARSGLGAEQRAMLDDTLSKERDAMRALFALIDASVAPREGVVPGMSEEDQALVNAWRMRWQTVFRRKAAAEEAVVGEAAVEVAVAISERERAVDGDEEGSMGMEGGQGVMSELPVKGGENGVKVGAGESATEGAMEADNVA